MQNSTNGMMLMVNLDVDDICRLLKVCARLGVREFKLDALTFSLGAEPIQHYLSPTPSSATGKSEIIEKEYVEAEELKLKETELAEMMLNDPLGYEKLIEQGDLEHGAEN